MLKKYNSYKNADIEWIDEIPSSWILNKFSRVVFFQEGPGLRNWQFTDSGVKVICVTNIVPPNIIFGKYIKHISFEEYQGMYQHFTVNKGDLLLASSGASWGKVAEYVGDEQVILNTSTIRLNSNATGELDKNFIKWLIQSPYIDEQLNQLLTGSCQPNFGPTHLKKLYCVYPESIEEQTAIATFLDRKTAEIDTLINKKKQLIALLKEERTAIINHAVTKGIDPNVKYRDSGIDWIGEIPAHWEVKKLKYLCQLVVDRANEKPDFIIALENISSWTGEIVGNTLENTMESEVNLFKKGDILFNKLRPYLAKVIQAPKDGGSAGELLVLRPNQFITSDFLYNRLSSEAIITIVDGSTYGTKMPRASWDKFISLIPIPTPPLEEQNKIAAYVTNKRSEIATIISKAEKEIDLMQEYKTALISEVVTGKVDVREEVMEAIS